MSNIIQLSDSQNPCEHDKKLNDLLARAEIYIRDKRLMPEELVQEMEEFAQKYID